MKIVIKHDSKVLNEILATVRRVEERQVTNMATVKEQLDAIQAALDSAGTALENGSASLQNIAADEAAQTKLILDLQAQIAAGGTVTPESLQPLVDSAMRQQKASQTLADALKAAADAIPDAPPPTP